MVNIFRTRELDEKSVIRKFRITARDGKSYNTNHYNLDSIISVGYRVNSKRATAFRIWATKVLKDHLLKGYTVNQKLLLSQKNKFRELQTTIDYLENQAKHDLLRSQGLELLSLVRDYTRSLNLYRPNGERKINDNALVALALLVAVSPSSEKELIIDLTKSLIA